MILEVVFAEVDCPLRRLVRVRDLLDQAAIAVEETARRAEPSRPTAASSLSDLLPHDS
jgi:hypothetical protein